MKLSWRRLQIQPRHFFATSQGGIDLKEVIVVELEHDGLVGLGEIIPSNLYGTTLESSEAALARMDQALGGDPFDIEAIVRRMIERFDDQRAAIAGVDSALHDWVGKKTGLPTYRLLGLPRPRKQTTFTLGVADIDQIRGKLDEALDAGFDALKIKVGVEHDHETLAIIRERFDGPLLLDANEAWDPREAGGKIRALARYRPTLIEQPLPRADWRAMKELRNLDVAPIFSDENCERPADVVRLHGFVDGVNIKFPKCGGIREALRMITIARALDMGVMLGCFVCTSLAIAPPLTVATLADFADLDGHLLLADDPFEGIGRSGGTIELSDRPGLGIRPRG